LEEAIEEDLVGYKKAIHVDGFTLDY
jgi:sugar/nucleoside kinase (ribokinase family)